MTVVALALVLGCGGSPAGHGHSHGSGGHSHGPGGHSHGAAGGHAHGADDGTTVGITRWTTDHELFVELGAPVVGQRYAYQAHVTRLADNQPVTSGQLTLVFEDDGFAIESHTDDAVVRPGVFSSQAAAPSKPGSYTLQITYRDGDTQASWSGGTVTVGADEPVAHEGSDDGEITFPKQSQWQVPFGVAPAAEVPLAPTVRAPGVVEAHPGTTAIVAAPVEGLLAWTDGLPVVGRTVTRGERLATLIPAGAAQHWSRLQADLATAQVDRGLAAKELERVEDLARRDLLPARRLEEARAGAERANAELSATQRRVSALHSGGAGAMPIRAPAAGVVVSVGGAHGVSVAAGAPLIGVATDDSLFVAARVHDRVPTALRPVASLGVVRGDWSRPVDITDRADLLTEQLVYDPRTLSAPVAVQIHGPVGLSVGDVVEVLIGVGSPEARLAIPRSAVIEINGQDVVFVQRSGESFTRRRVVLGEVDPTHVEVLGGIEPGERVVVEGGFDVHVASLSGALESHRH